MKKVILLILLLFISVGVVNASDDIPSGVKEAINEYIKNINEDDLNATKYIDEANKQLSELTKDKINGLDLKYEIKDIKKNEDNTYTVKGIVGAEGPNFKISGFEVNFTLKQNDNGSYVIVNTNLFDVLDGKNIINFVFIIFAIIFGVFIIVGIISTVIIVINVNKNKKRLAMK